MPQNHNIQVKKEEVIHPKKTLILLVGYYCVMMTYMYHQGNSHNAIFD
jgi:hypothetical protein